MPRKLVEIIILLIIVMGLMYLTACDHKPNTSLGDDNTSHKTTEDDIVIDSDRSSEGEARSDVDYDTGLHNNRSKIVFVQEDYFYSDTVYIEIASDQPGDIYYTMDGSDPDKTKELYRDKIELKSDSQTKIYNLKAKGYYEDGTETDTIVRTYFVGKNVDSRFDTLVFSVTSDPYNFYDYEYGILIEGKLRDDFIRENPGRHIDPPDPANYNIRGRESEREIYLEIFEPDGTVVASQNAGLRVYGGWSRANIQKSVRLFARKAYDEVDNKFRYEFFPTKRAANGDGTIIRNFKRLVLRNSGNDNGFGFIRDELFQTIAGFAGFRDYQAVRPAALFINGEYKGHLWLHETYSDEYFEEHYGEYEGAFEVLEGGENFKKLDDDGSNGYAIDDYEEAYSYAYKDLTDDTVYEELRGLIDVENYLEYYAYQIYIGNEDWPHNNYRTYRYYAAEGEEYGEAPFDGKWRYLLHDLDFSFGIYGADPWIDYLAKFVSVSGEINKESPLFSQLLRREDCKEFFVTRTLDYINGAFASNNFNKILDELNASRMNEQLRMYGKDLLADWLRPNQLPERINDIKQYGLDRRRYILVRYRNLFGQGEDFNLKVLPEDGSGVRINNIETYSKFDGTYYPGFDTVIKAIIPAGKELGHWQVNGEIIYDKELIINSSLINDNKEIEVVSVLKDQEDNLRPIISEICSDGDQDYIILYNPYKEDISLQGYSITDDKEEPGKLILSARLLRSGQTIEILGESNSKAPDRGMIRAGFNLKDGETVALYLYGELIDEVTIPNLRRGNIYVRDMVTLRFYEEPRLTDY